MTEECLSVNDFTAYVDGFVRQGDMPRIEAHLFGCSECREMVVFLFRMKEMYPDPVRPKPSAQ